MDFIKYTNLKYDRTDRTIYFLSSESGMQQLWKLDRETGTKTRMTDFSQNVKNYWLEDGHMTVATDHHGNERNQFSVLSGKDDVHTVTDAPEYFHHYGKYDAENRRYICIRNHYESSKFELCSVSVEGEIDVLKTFDRPIGFEGEAGKNMFLFTEDVDNINKALFIYHAETGEIETLDLPRGRFSSFAKYDDGSAYCLADWEGDFLNLYKLDLTTFKHRKVTGYQWDVEHFKLSEDKREAVMSINGGGCSILHRLDTDTGRITPLDFRQDGVVHSINWGGDGELLLVFSSVDVPHVLYKFSVEGGENEVLMSNEKDAAAVQWITTAFDSFDSLEVPYFIYRHEGRDAPTVIHIHGGPESQARPEFNRLYYQLHREGFNVVVPNIRGSTGYGRPYFEADDRRRRLDAVEDVVSLRQHLCDEGIAEAHRVSVMGRSYGGLMTLLLITHHPDLWRSAIDIVGISDVRTFLENTPPWRSGLRAAEYGSIEADGAFLDDISPLGRSRDVRTRLKIFHSHHDSRVPCSESIQMEEALRHHGKDVEMTLYENEGHTFMRQENIDDMEAAILKFLTATMEMDE